MARGDSAVETGGWVAQTKDGKHLDHGTYMTLYKKVRGTWKIYRDTWNSSMKGQARRPGPRVVSPTSVPPRSGYRIKPSGRGRRFARRPSATIRWAAVPCGVLPRRQHVRNR